MNKYDLIVIGYLLHDIIINKKETKECPGGVAMYTSIAANKLGMKVGIVSKIGPDYKYKPLLKGIDLTGISRQEKTTIFHNDYTKGKRTQKVFNIGQKIQFKDVPKKYLNTRAVHLGPVFNEISINAIKSLRKNSNAIITLDPQGFVRKQVNGIVREKQLDLNYLKYVDVLKISMDEANNLKNIINTVKIVLLTDGSKGVTIYVDGKKVKHVPIVRTQVVDETGAGDAFIAGFIKKFIDTKDPVISALYGNVVASFCVEGYGAEGLQTKKVTDKRFNKLLRA